jgi:membrane associated rhomboid family serine protease
MTNALPEDLESPRLTRAVQWLIAVNVAIYFLQVTIVGAGNMHPALGFASRDLSTKWWTIATHMFVHGGFWHLAMNLYMLWLFGPRIERAWSAGEFTRYYVLCGLGGWFFHLLFARESLLIGASAAILGVMLAYAMRWPDDEVLVLFLLPLKVKWLVAILAVVNVIGGMTAGGEGGGVAYMAHLGGLAAGWLYLRSSTATSIDRFRQRVSQVPDLPDETPRAIPRSLPRVREKGREIDDVVARSNAALSRRPAPAPHTAPKPPQRTSDLNLVLDKISERGIDSLTSSERKLLEEMSKELRKRE